VGVTPLQLQKAVVLLRYRRVVHRRSRARPIRWRASACGQPVFMPPTVHSRAGSLARGPAAPRRCGRSCSPRPLPRRFCCAGRSAAPASFAHNRLALGYPYHRPSAVDQQRAQIGIAVLADAQKPLLAATGVLLGDQSQPGRQLPSVPCQAGSGTTNGKNSAQISWRAWS
jgi:hypothetical protein